MFSFRMLWVATVALVAGGLLSGCSEATGGSGDKLQVEIGVVQSLSGAGGIYGNSVLQGIRLAVSEINASEKGVKLSITLIDDGSDPETGKQAFETLTGRGVTAIIGPTLSNVALQAMPVAQSASVPVLGATTTAQGINEIGDYIFRVALTEDVVVPATIERVNKETPIAGAVLVYDSSDAFSRSSADAMRKGMDQIGGTIVSEVDVATTDIQSTFAHLHGKSFNAFLITPLVDESVDIVKALRAGGFQQTIIGGSSFNTPSIADKAGNAVEGAYVGAAWNPGVDSAASKSFVKAYTDKYKTAPDLFAAQGYSSVYLLLDAVKRAGVTNGPAVRVALASVADVETPLGKVSMSPDRESVHTPVVQRFEGGKLIVLP